MEVEPAEVDLVCDAEDSPEEVQLKAHSIPQAPRAQSHALLVAARCFQGRPPASAQLTVLGLRMLELLVWCFMGLRCGGGGGRRGGKALSLGFSLRASMREDSFHRSWW